MCPNEKVGEDGVPDQSLFIPGDPSKSASAQWVPIARCRGIKSGLGLWRRLQLGLEWSLWKVVVLTRQV